MVNSNLIFDLGMNHGEDTEFYLRKDFKVVAIEASPVIYKEMSDKFAPWIENGQLVIINQGIWDSAGTLQFYRNLDNDHWSSFDVNYGTRNGTRYEVLDIETRTIGSLIDEFGVPYYLKIDIEGADRIVVDALKNINPLPTFVSVEEYGVPTLSALAAVGYDRFAIVPQRDKSSVVPPNPALEGRYFDKAFDGRDTGLFGRELPYPWLPYDEAYRNFIENVRDENFRYKGPEHEWFDIHATVESNRINRLPTT